LKHLQLLSDIVLAMFTIACSLLCLSLFDKSGYWLLAVDSALFAGLAVFTFLEKTSMKISLLIPLVFVFTMILLAASLGHCRTTSKQPNSFGTVVYNENPFAYIVGEIIGGGVVGSGSNTSFSVRIHPRGTYLLFDESVLFCGTEDNVRKLLEDGSHLKAGTLAFTYRRQGSRIVEGIACHDIVAVDKLQ